MDEINLLYYCKTQRDGSYQINLVVLELVIFSHMHIKLCWSVRFGLKTMSSCYCYQISTLPILSVEDEATLNDDEECAARQIVRHVCVALKRYLEAHLCIKAENLRRTQFRETGGQLEPVLPPAKVSTEHLFML